MVKSPEFEAHKRQLREQRLNDKYKANRTQLAPPKETDTGHMSSLATTLALGAAAGLGLTGALNDPISAIAGSFLTNTKGINVNTEDKAADFGKLVVGSALAVSDSVQKLAGIYITSKWGIGGETFVAPVKYLLGMPAAALRQARSPWQQARQGFQDSDGWLSGAWKGFKSGVMAYT
jgi:hypothetical protein